MNAEDFVVQKSTELEKEFGNKSLGFLLFTMGLKYNTTDYERLYRDNVTDGQEDKKVDFFCLDRESGNVTIAQSYQSADWRKSQPPSNKAADLNTAVNWLLDANPADIPEESIRTQAIDLRDALSEGIVSSVEVMMIHNLEPCEKVQKELEVVGGALQKKLSTWRDPGEFPIRVAPTEVSFRTAVDWYNSRNSTIAIMDEITISSLSKPQSESSGEWQSIVVSLKGKELVDLAQKYGDKLFSSNVRDFLGVRSSSRNINRQIEKTAKERPSDFWVFNNGITVLTKQFEIKDNDVKCSGLAVINGAQTIGSLAGSMPNERIGEVSVLARIVSATKETLIQDIIRYNNTQNPIKAWELRVNDPVQDRIKKELEAEFGLVYQLRRGTTRRSAEDIHYEKVGPWLNSFYGDPISSHRNSPEIYEQDAKYSRIFNSSSDVRNLLFIYRLGETIGAVKDEYRQKVNNNDANADTATLYGFFRFPAFSYVVLSICAKALKHMLNTKDDSFVFRAKMKDEILNDFAQAKGVLEGLVKIVLAPIVPYLKDKEAYAEFKTKGGVEAITSAVLVSLQQLEAINKDIYCKFRKDITID